MLSNISLGLRGLQMILAIAILGLSASLIHERACETDSRSGAEACYRTVTLFWGKDRGEITVRYCIFLGIYGIAVATLGAICLFVDRIPMIVPIVGDSVGALFFLAGGIAWAVHFEKLGMSCGDVKSWLSYLPVLHALPGTCRQSAADHGLAWALFVFTAILAICDFFRRRELGQSSK